MDDVLDAQEYISKMFDIDEETTLPLWKVVEVLLNKKLCKAEQVSNWERRPLRESQMHYAAADAHILIEIIELLWSNEMNKLSSLE